MKTKRELFNEWLKYYEKHDVVIDQLQCAFMWQAWQASAQRQGYKFVPVETLEESLDWASVAKWDSPNNARDEEINKHEEIIRALIGATNEKTIWIKQR